MSKAKLNTTPRFSTQITYTFTPFLGSITRQGHEYLDSRQ